MGRLNTMLRYKTEKSISHPKRRYEIFRFIPWYVVSKAGIDFQSIKSIHNKFDIGVIKSSYKRQKMMEWTNCVIQSYLFEHPITNPMYTEATKNIRQYFMQVCNTKFVYKNCLQNIYWKIGIK